MVAENIPALELAASPTRQARVPALDLLRLVAVLGVVLFHYGFRGPPSHGETLVALSCLTAVARYGYLGVPVFFIISGFVIAYSAQGRTAREFAVARFARIYPTFVLCMTVTCLATLGWGGGEFQTGLRQWLANLAIASPALGQPYMDTAYWSLVAEVTFYGWVALLMAAGLFPKRIDAIVLVWLAISIANELTIDAPIVEKIFLADYSGFFATGLLTYELYLGRRDTRLQALLAAAIGIAIFQAVHNLAWLRDQTGSAFDDWIVAAVCLTSIWIIIGCTQIRRLPVPAGVTLAVGGLTYPFYLLHQKLGYVIFGVISPRSHMALTVAIIQLGIALVSWLLWRFVERPMQRWVKQFLTARLSAGLWLLRRKPRLGTSA